MDISIGDETLETCVLHPDSAKVLREKYLRIALYLRHASVTDKQCKDIVFSGHTARSAELTKEGGYLKLVLHDVSRPRATLVTYSTPILDHQYQGKPRAWEEYSYGDNTVGVINIRPLENTGENFPHHHTLASPTMTVAECGLSRDVLPPSIPVKTEQIPDHQDPVMGVDRDKYLDVVTAYDREQPRLDQGNIDIEGITMCNEKQEDVSEDAAKSDSIPFCQDSKSFHHGSIPFHPDSIPFHHEKSDEQAVKYGGAEACDMDGVGGLKNSEDWCQLRGVQPLAQDAHHSNISYPGIVQPEATGPSEFRTATAPKPVCLVSKVQVLTLIPTKELRLVGNGVQPGQSGTNDTMYPARSGDVQSVVNNGNHEPRIGDVQSLVSSGMHEPMICDVQSSVSSGMHEPMICDVQSLVSSGMHKPRICDVQSEARNKMYEPRSGDVQSVVNSRMHEPRSGDVQSVISSGMHEPRSGDVQYVISSGMHEPRSGDVQSKVSSRMHEPRSGDVQSEVRNKMYEPRSGDVQSEVGSKMYEPRSGDIQSEVSNRMYEPGICDVQSEVRNKMYEPRSGDVQTEVRNKMYEPRSGDVQSEVSSGMHEPRSGDVQSKVTSRMHGSRNGDIQSEVSSRMHETRGGDVQSQSKTSSRIYKPRSGDVQSEVRNKMYEPRSGDVQSEVGSEMYEPKSGDIQSEVSNRMYEPVICDVQSEVRNKMYEPRSGDVQSEVRNKMYEPRSGDVQSEVRNKMYEPRSGGVQSEVRNKMYERRSGDVPSEVGNRIHESDSGDIMNPNVVQVAATQQFVSMPDPVSRPAHIVSKAKTQTSEHTEKRCSVNDEYGEAQPRTKAIKMPENRFDDSHRDTSRRVVKSVLVNCELTVRGNSIYGVHPRRPVTLSSDTYLGHRKVQGGNSTSTRDIESRNGRVHPNTAQSTEERTCDGQLGNEVTEKKHNSRQSRDWERKYCQWLSAKGRFYCLVCKKSRQSRRGIRAHIQTHIWPFEWYQCSHCGRAFTQLRLLKLHKMRQGDKLHKCTQCDASFSFSCEYKKHLREFHKQGVFLCEPCGKSLPTSRHLAEHPVGEKVYKCHICGEECTSGRTSHGYMLWY